jgi:parvulin-like peptidyl-prolyl isomerase
MKRTRMTQCPFVLLISATLLVACSEASASQAGASTPDVQASIFSVTVNAPTVTPADTPAPGATPQVTSQPTPATSHLAARVNGQDITLDQFNAEMLRYLASTPGSPDPNSDGGRRLAAQYKDAVLDGLIEQTLIEQEAVRTGVTVSDRQIDDEIAVAEERAGGEQRYRAWLAATRQTEQDARELARRELLTNAMRDRVLTQLPRTAEYAHAYHIVVQTETEARQIQAKLQNGAKFTALALSESIDDSTRTDGGDLGWFTRNSGSVLWTEVEEAAFALKPGETSDIVKSPIGYHIIKVVDRQTRALTDSDSAYLQETALSQWLAQLRAKAQIEKFI